MQNSLSLTRRGRMYSRSTSRSAAMSAERSSPFSRRGRHTRTHASRKRYLYPTPTISAMRSSSTGRMSSFERCGSTPVRPQRRVPPPLLHTAAHRIVEIGEISAVSRHSDTIHSTTLLYAARSVLFLPPRFCVKRRDAFLRDTFVKFFPICKNLLTTAKWRLK